MHRSSAGLMQRTTALTLVFAMLLALIPQFTLPISAADAEFSSGAVYLDEAYSNKTVYIKQGVFSVTVNGAQNVNLIFGERTGDGSVGVTIDRRYANDNSNNGLSGDPIDKLYEVSQKLGATGKAQTCPLLITGGSTVTATFHGKCRFYAGTNGCRVSNSNVYTARATGCGFAGIQVDSGSSLTIDGADDLQVFGGHQFAIPGDDGYATINGDPVLYSDVLRANHSVGDHTDPFGDSQYEAPDNASAHTESGGAGIGGGASLATTTSGSQSFINGAPGTIIINGGTIEAYGGHQAAGIGGAVNSAASTGMIQINNGTVTAHGGRWAAGIGDGDSSDPTWYGTKRISNTFRDAETLIEINGGTVEAYGGVAASGIGTSDQISHSKGHGTDFVRKLQVNLNGGTIRAFSGFPDNFSGSNFPASAPAAIGAGVDTMMNKNSIYVSSNADLRSGGFGHYALSEDGQDAQTVPTIAVDSDGYLLLLQTADYYSEDTRTLKVYKPQTVNKMVDLDGDNVLDTEVEAYIYTTQSTSNSTPPKYYMVTTQDENGVESTILFGEDGKRKNNVDNLTLYVDANSTELTELRIEFPYYFRSVALTLPHPEEHGGLYALAVPTNGVSSSNKPGNGQDIILTIDAREQGTQNGTITFPSENNLNSRPVSAPLIDLDIDGDDSTDGLIGDSFYPTVYGYTVYAEPGTTEVDLYLAFGTKTGTTYELVFNSGENPPPFVGDGDIQEVRQTGIPLTGEETVLRVQKKDVDGEINPDPISYKITIIRKDDFSLQLTDPSKVYDGQPAKTAATLVDVPEEDLELVEYTYYKTHNADGTKITEILMSAPPTDAGQYRVVAELRTKTYNASGEGTFTIGKRPLKVLRIENWLAYVTQAPTGDKIPITNPGYIELDNVVTGDNVTLSVETGNVYYDDPDSNTLAVDYRSDKIVLAEGTLVGGEAHNYRLDYENPSLIRVYGQLAYKIDGAIFRKNDDSDWRKYYPVTSTDPVNSATADYHSPVEESGVYLSHAEYIRARTVNAGADEARYCIDIEYGAMTFGFYYDVWDVNNLEYIELKDSHWTGMDGTNNQLTIVNYSNREIKYTLTLTRDASYGGKIGFAIKTTNDQTDGTSLLSLTNDSLNEATSAEQTVAAAAAGAKPGDTGTAAKATSYVILSGVPQFAEGITPSVGLIGISLSP